MAIVYLITNKLNGKKYVGQTKKTLQERFNSHCRKRYAKHSLLTRSILKDGRENFTLEILEIVDVAKLIDIEHEYIHKLNTLYPNGYNLTDKKHVVKNGILTQKMTKKCLLAASIARRGSKHTEECKKRMALAKLGKTAPHKRKPVKLIKIDTGEIFIYDSVNSAAKSLNLNRRSVSNVLNGWALTTGGYKVSYLNAEVQYRT